MKTILASDRTRFSSTLHGELLRSEISSSELTTLRELREALHSPDPLILLLDEELIDESEGLIAELNGRSERAITGVIILQRELHRYQFSEGLCHRIMPKREDIIPFIVHTTGEMQLIREPSARYLIRIPASLFDSP